MNNNKYIPITYAPYRHYGWITLLCAPVILLMVMPGSNIVFVSDNGLPLRQSSIHLSIIVPMVMILACAFVDSCTEIVFYEDKINIKHLFNKKCLEKKYTDFTHVYFCKNYRNVTYLVLSTHFFTRNELRRIVNKNYLLWDRMFFKDAVFIRINHWSKEKDRIEDLIRHIYVNMEKFD